MNSDFRADKLYVAVTTPFAADLSIDFEALVDHLDFLTGNGITAIFLGGTTGEFDTLTLEEKEALLATVRNSFSGTIVFNVSSCSLKESLRLVAISETYGADAITALPPFYRASVGDDAVEQFINAIADSTDLPFILYSFNRHTQNPITPELLAKIHCEAVKDSDKEFRLIPASPCYLCGGDSIILETFQRGGKGVVSVQGNYQPLQIKTLFDAARSNSTEAQQLQEQVAKTATIFRKTKQISRIKQALSVLIPGYPATVRLPLLPLDFDESTEILTWCREA